MNRRNIFDEMDRMLERMRASSGSMGGSELLGRDDVDRGMGVNLTTESTDEGFVVLADLPGFEKSEIDLRYEDGRLTIAAESDVETDDDGFRSRRRRSVREAVSVPVSVVESEISATYRNGVLEIVLPTDEEGDEGIHVDID